jgi:type II secretory pathway predicted ATPase ExeA
MTNDWCNRSFDIRISTFVIPTPPMYETYYNLIAPPFHNTPNPRFFFETEQHREALAKLEYTVRNRRGFALVTGDIGAGKTTLIRTLVRRLGADARIAMINNTRVTSRQLLELIVTEYQLDVPNVEDKAALLTAVRQFVEQQHTMGRCVVIIIDEGQCLSIDAFEEIRLLTNLESETDKLVQLLILGQPELRVTLKHPRLAPLIQRIVMYTHLKPMSFDDMTRYIAFRLVRASRGRPNVDFSREALRQIYEYSKGVPRLTNLVCDNALLVGYSSDTRLIDSAVIRRAISQMLPNFDGQLTDVFSDDEPVAEQEQELDDGRRL